MSAVRSGVVLCCSFVSVGAAGQPLPVSVDGYEVLARGVFSGPGFALPPRSQVTNITPRLNNAGDVVFAYFDDNLDKRIWVNGVTVPSAPAFFLSSDPHINAGLLVGVGEEVALDHRDAEQIGNLVGRKGVGDVPSR